MPVQQQTVIIDYGLGNVRSILNMFKRIGSPAVISRQPKDITSAARLIVPGVGAFDTAMRLLDESGVRSALDDSVLNRRTPVLGICLGMQLLGRSSEEGELPGLGWLAADTKRLTATPGYRIPHMGWNWVSPARESVLFPAGAVGLRYYFVHSYAVVCDDEETVLATTSHGAAFASSVGARNVFGVQFHPEKSHRFGMELLSRFIGLEQ